MKSKKTMSEKQFFNLSKSQQEKELKKMTKRANVRLSLLEEKDSINLAYREAYQYNMGQDRENNRFYEGTRYKTEEDVKNAYKAVSSFLENKSSTLKGVEENVKDIVKNMTNKNEIDEKIINKMNTQEKRYASKYIAQAGNKKLSELEKNNITQYAYGLAEYYNKSEGRDNNRFYRGIKFDKESDLEKHLDNMIHFYNAKTSSVEGYQESIVKRIEAFKDRGIKIPDNREAEFFQFLASNEFKKMGSRVDSNQVLKAFNEARNIGKEVEEINNAFRIFLDTNVTFDKIEENLGVAQWEKKTKFRKK